MYERFHSLRERPFSLTPDPDYLYPSRVHKEALSYLRYGIEGRAGFIVITGEIGSGKTTLLQTTLRGLDNQISVARLVNTMLDARELLEAVLLDFGIDPGNGRGKPHLLRDLANYLVAQRSAGRLALLVIDEAQNLSFSALEEIRMLSNLETEKSKLIQIALVGQPGLRDLLASPELEQLRQRVTVSYHLQALDAAETAAYINHRLRRAAIGAPLEFHRDVTDLIHGYSKGVPRKINVIADAVLLFAYGEEQHTITRALTYEVLDELEGTGVLAPLTTSRENAPKVTVASNSAPVASDVDAIRRPRPGAAEPDYPMRAAPLAAEDRLPAVRSTPQPATGAAVRPEFATAPASAIAAAGARPAAAPAPPIARTTLPPTAPPLTELARSTAVAEPLRPVPGTEAPRPFSTSAPVRPSVPAALRPTMSAPAARPSATLRSVPGAAPARRQEPQSLWDRLRRGLSVLAKPAFED